MPSGHSSKTLIMERETKIFKTHIDFGAKSSSITNPVCLEYLKLMECFKNKRVLHKSFTQIFTVLSLHAMYHILR